MKRKFILSLAILVCFATLFTLFIVNVNAADQTITSNQTGTHGGYDYELWKDNGTTSMTLKDGGAFSCSWSNINNALFRKGKKYNETQTYQQLGNITMDYACNYQPNGNSYLSVYGWTSSPLVEYYIIESYGTWKPPGSNSPKGTVTVDGGTYEIYETTRTNQPSIKGNTTFQQYWSVRTSKRTSGTISVSEHFKAWEAKGMKMGKMYEVSLVVEGYQSSGKADVTKMSINVGGSNNTTQTTTKVEPVVTPSNDTPTNNDLPASVVANLESENYSSTTSSTVKTFDNGIGGKSIGYIESGDTATYTNVDFGSGASSFSASVGSEQSSSIDIRLDSADGTLLGTLADVSTGSWDTYEKKSTNISNITGKHDIVLVFSGPVNIDSFEFSSGSANENTTPANNDTTTTTPPATDNTVKPSTIPTGKVVALTFDDGPSSQTTKVLDKLKKYNAKGTFMVIGSKISGADAVMKRIVSEGHEIGNHSWDYSSMNSLSASQISDSIQKTSDAIKKYTGTEPKFFRAPNLSTSQTMFSTIKMTFVQGVIAQDWNGGSATTAQARADLVVNGVKDGSIVLLHSDQPDPHPTPEALDIIIPKLQAQGYSFVTLSELFQAKGKTPPIGKVVDGAF